MTKRFSDIKIWKSQKWFKKLNPNQKLAWLYLTAICDHAGIWKIDISEFLDDTGLEEFDLDDFLLACNHDYDKKSGKKVQRERIAKIETEHLWLTGFICFQYGDKAQKICGISPAIKSAFDMLKAFNVYELAIKKGYILFGVPLNPSKPLQTVPNPLEPFGTPSNGSEPLQRGKDKDKALSLGDSGSEKGDGAVKWNNKPSATDLNGLPEVNAGAAIEFIRIKQHVTITIKDVMGMWNIFKIQNLTGENFYSSKEKVYSHFLNWIKDKEFINKGGKESNYISGPPLTTLGE